MLRCSRAAGRCKKEGLASRNKDLTCSRGWNGVSYIKINTCKLQELQGAAGRCRVQQE
jgi:hypothetical protein